MQKSGRINLSDREKFFLEDEGFVEIAFLNRELLGDSLKIGAKFTFGEGEISALSD